MFFCYFIFLTHFPGNNYTSMILFRSCKDVSSEVEKKSSKSKKKTYLCFIKPVICLTFTLYTLSSILYDSLSPFLLPRTWCSSLESYVKMRHLPRRNQSKALVELGSCSSLQEWCDEAAYRDGPTTADVGFNFGLCKIIPTSYLPKDLHSFVNSTSQVCASTYGNWSILHVKSDCVWFCIGYL